MLHGWLAGSLQLVAFLALYGLVVFALLWMLLYLPALILHALGRAFSRRKRPGDERP